jgi:hypothetical protein
MEIDSDRQALDRLLRDGGGQELLEAVTRLSAQLDARAVLVALKNPYVGSEVIEVFLGQRRLLTSVEVRRELAAHPKTPEVRALNLVHSLFWKDLVRLGANSRVRPRVRRAADLRLAERLPKLSVGERIAAARQAGPGVIGKLRHDPSPRVIEGLLENPRLTEGLLMPLASSDTAQPEVLARVAENPRWGVRYPIRVALARNAKTPVKTALGVLSVLKKRDLEMVAADRKLAGPVRQRANLLLGRGS